jgi:hypothetical protein
LFILENELPFCKDDMAVKNGPLGKSRFCHDKLKENISI